MKRSARRVAWAFVLLAASTGSTGCPKHDGPPERIILIVVDTLRRDHISPYGHLVATPNLQRLADRGQVFSNAIASFHQTTMSMAALFTGRTPSIESGDSKQPLSWTGRNWCGMTRFAESLEDTCIPQGMSTLAEDLSRAGYHTVGVVSNRFLFQPAGYDQGFDEWIEVAGDDPDESRKTLSRKRSGARVQAAVNEALGRIPERPLFLYVHYMDVHDYGIRGDTYSEGVSRVDQHVGRLLDRLEKRGVLEDAVVFFTSDHGEILGEKFPGYGSKTHIGNPSLQPVLEIPLIVAPPRFDDADRLVRSQDISGLIRGVAGATTEPDSALAPDEIFYSEMNYLTYRKGPFKSIFRRRGGMRSWGLFDLEADPDESVNVISVERELGLEHLARVGELVKVLAASGTRDQELTEADRARLRALGYLDE